MQDKLGKKTRTKAKATKKPAKKTTNPSELFDLDDDDESEVELDSLGSFFVHLIDNDHYQDDAEASRADVEEVTLISSSSEPSSRQRTRKVSRKVRFSHPLAYLDPNFILKQQQHEAHRQTRNSGGTLSSGLPNTPAPRKRRNEVPKKPSLSYPKAGLIRQPLNPSDSNYQVTSHSSSGESTGTQIPVFKVAPG